MVGGGGRRKKERYCAIAPSLLPAKRCQLLQVGSLSTRGCLLRRGRNSQGDRWGGLGPALGLRGLDLSSILSGAPGRAERKVGGEEERRANLELSGGPGEAADERPRLPLDTVNGRTRRRARCDWTNRKAKRRGRVRCTVKTK